MKYRAALGLALFFFALLNACVARGDTWRVHADGTGDAPTIQAGIDSASSGDIVLLSGGTYKGEGNRDIDFKGKSVTVESSTGAAFTTIDCEGLGRGIVFKTGEGVSSVLSGVRIVNGFHPVFGGAVFCVNASPTIENNVFSGNHAGFRGGAIFCDTSSAVVTANTFENNDASYGGALACSGLSSIGVADNEFRSNTAAISGGAIACRASALRVEDNRFTENAATNDGGAIYCDEGSSPLVSTNTFRQNTAGGNGGAIGLVQSSPTIEFNLFIGNESVLGGGVFCNNFSSGPIRSNTFDGNAASSGAAVYCTNFSAPSISKNIVVNGTGGSPIDTKNDSVPVIGCSCLFNNAGGNALPLGSIDGGGNFSEDPEFCGIDGSGNYLLQADSPCAPGNTQTPEQCGQIGAFAVSCGTTPTKEKTWGEIKALYGGE